MNRRELWKTKFLFVGINLVIQYLFKNTELKCLVLEVKGFNGAFVLNIGNYSEIIC